MYSISQVSEILGINPHTLRYYEKEGIITPDRSTAGVRSYTDSHIKWLNFVMKLRETEMPISDIKKYTQFYLEGPHTTKERLTLLEEHQLKIQKQIQSLVSTNDMLTYKIDTYKELIGVKKSEHNIRVLPTTIDLEKN
ncbi:MerR family transcriptional regulator (plasmid) [Cytobacillus spongiae]|uniref:MerR family transcriptional regulator n=1 Tax=Cytobacillus spongiae TaxID=2901381 RepID=UPI00145F4C49|nr:MerR family transcriptional regulator [Cytobacillus spongiae]NMH69972.1 MerR family transcriptional regulator [Bacillus sp. RO3]UII58266.1 MerR family transcriptional regulator [Cytobacillus spongiae]